MFAAVEFLGRGRSTEVTVVPDLWLTDNNTYCFWPRNVKSEAAFLELVKKKAIYQKGWSKHKVHKVLRTSEKYKDVEDYARDLIDEGTTDDAGTVIEVIRKPLDDQNCGDDDSVVGKENVDPRDVNHPKPKKHLEKKGKGTKRTRANNSSSAEDSSSDSPQSSSPKDSESPSKSDANSSGASRSKKKQPKRKKKTHKRRKEDETSKKDSDISNVENPRSSVSKKTSCGQQPDVSGHGVDYVSQMSTELNNQSPPTQKASMHNGNGLESQEFGKSHRRNSFTPKSTLNNGLSEANQESGSSNRQLRHTPPSSHNAFRPRQIFQASPETHDKIFGSRSSVRGDLSDDLWFRRRVLEYLEGSRTLFEQICNVLSQVLQTTQASLMGTEKPKELPDLPIADVHAFELFDRMLVDPVIKGYMKNRLMSIGGETVRAVVMGMMRGVISDGLATQYNWAGHNDKKKFDSTNLSNLICESTKQALRKRIKATDKEIKGAMKDWLKQASNRIKGRAKASRPDRS